VHRLLSFVFSIPGLCVLAALDSTPFYYLPLGIDAAVVVVAARHQKIFWLIGPIAAAASLGGAALTFWIGERLGQKGLQHFVPQRRLEAIERRVHNSGAFALALMDLIPPPFPFTACILAAGGLRTARKVFLTTLLFTRFIRFGGESIIAAVWGPEIINRIESEEFAIVAVLLVLLGLVGGIFSLYRTVRTMRVH
jgi:uncharacterized membrane protein YdjX (TVP38/TMEM64 family)